MVDYLLPYKNSCNIQKLSELKQERSSWIERKSTIHYKELLENLPKIEAKKLDLNKISPMIGDPSELDENQREQINQLAESLIPWRKGPFNLFGNEIDAEWRSDQKWDRLESCLDSLEGKRVLDIGCNNGYFLLRMAAQNPELLLGIDPYLHYKIQFEFLNHFAKLPNTHFELFGIEHLSYFKEMFDVIFSMGIIYHHRHPIEQLLQIKDALRPGGQVILETIGIPGDESNCLFPEDRYAKMKNVWFVPTMSAFINWAKRSKFVDVEIISDSLLTSEEQRLTPWCPPPHQSLDDFLNPNDPTLTLEGYPAPRRFAISARKRK